MVRGAQEKKKMTDSEQRRMFVFRLREILLDMVWLCSVLFNVRVETPSFFQTLFKIQDWCNSSIAQTLSLPCIDHNNYCRRNDILDTDTGPAVGMLQCF